MTQTNSVLSPTPFAQIMVDRFSCRKFRPEPVAPGVLEEVFRLARHTASWCNAQSWHVDLTGPETTRALSQALLDDVSHRPPGGSDIPPPREYQGEYGNRRRAAGFALYDSLGIRREEKDRRKHQMLLNYEFFGAPHVAIISSPEELGPYGYVDCGGFIANVLNAAQSLGLSSIAQAAVVLRPKAVRSVLDIPNNRHLVAGIALGNSVEDDPVNLFRTERASVPEIVTIHP